MLTKLATLAWIFFQLGLFSIGGGYVILTLIYEKISTFGIMSTQEFSNLVGISQVTPGPIAVNAATYVGFNYASFAGAAVATLAVIFPSFIYMTLIYVFLDKFRKSKGINSFLGGIRPATIGLISSAVLTFMQNSILVQSFSTDFFSRPMEYISLPALGIAVFSGIAMNGIKGKSMSPILICLIAGVAGGFLL